MKKHISISVFMVFITLLSLLSINITQARPSDNPFTSTAVTYNEVYYPWNVEKVQHQSYLHVGTYNSIAYSEVDGYPYISYYDDTNGDLMLASPVPIGNGNCGENADWWCRVIDGDVAHGGGDVGQYSSIDIWGTSKYDWKLGISYYDTQGSIKAAIWSCFLLNCGWNMYTITDGSGINQFTSFKFSQDGTPHIAYLHAHSMDPFGSYLMYATYYIPESSNGPAAGFWVNEEVDKGVGIGYYPSLDFNFQGVPYIASYQAVKGDLRLAYMTGSGGDCFNQTAWKCLVIDDGGDSNGIQDTGSYPSLQAAQSSGDYYRIAYYDRTNEHLRYFDPFIGPTVVDEMGSSTEPMGIAMALDGDGEPIIAYQRIPLGAYPPELRVARPYSVFDDGEYGNCGDIVIAPSYQYWRCSTIDKFRDANTREANYVSMALSPRGLPMIAFSEADSSSNLTSLQVAYKYFQTYLPLLIKP